MRVYISGKIGEEVISDATRQKFARAEEMLKAKGYEVFNPCDERWQASLREGYEKDSKFYQPYVNGTMPDFHTYCLLRDLMALSIKDAILILPDFIYSDGAKTEYYFAEAVGKQILFASKHDAVLYLYSKRLCAPEGWEYNEWIDEEAKKIWLPL